MVTRATNVIEYDFLKYFLLVMPTFSILEILSAGLLLQKKAQSR